MKPRTLLGFLGFALLSSAVCNAQTRPAWIQDRFENLDFSIGAVGAMPSGWNLGPKGTTLYAAEVAAAASCDAGKHCGTVRSIHFGDGASCFLHQIVDATPYRGKQLAYRASVRADFVGDGVARLLVRIHREDGSTSFRDDMGNHPIKSGPWTSYEIDGPIPSDARDIEFGLQLFGEGSASIDSITVVFTDAAKSKSDEDSVRDLIKRFADYRNAHDGEAVAALYSELGEYLYVPSYNKDVVRGRRALAALWGSVVSQVERTVLSVDFPAVDIAVIRVAQQYPDPYGQHHETFVAVKESGSWLIRVHQTVD